MSVHPSPVSSCLVKEGLCLTKCSSKEQAKQLKVGWGGVGLHNAYFVLIALRLWGFPFRGIKLCPHYLPGRFHCDSWPNKTTTTESSQAVFAEPPGLSALTIDSGRPQPAYTVWCSGARQTGGQPGCSQGGVPLHPGKIEKEISIGRGHKKEIQPGGGTCVVRYLQGMKVPLAEGGVQEVGGGTCGAWGKGRLHRDWIIDKY